MEFPEGREQHVLARHPDLLLAGRKFIANTLADPDQVRSSSRFGNASLFSRWYDVLSKHVVVVVIDEPNGRKWVVTAYIARKLVAGAVEWERT